MMCLVALSLPILISDWVRLNRCDLLIGLLGSSLILLVALVIGHLDLVSVCQVL